MPELPEVETIRLSLLPLILNKQLVELTLFRDDIVRFHTAGDLVGLIADDIRRHGKYLLLDLKCAEDNTKSRTLIFHLRMTGKLLYNLPKDDQRKHTHVRFFWQDADNSTPTTLDFNDVRRFGRIDVIPWQSEMELPSIAKLGPDPIVGDFDLDGFKSALDRHPKTTIKQVLLMQEVLAGLGNIYVDELLFRTKIHPKRTVATLSQAERINLHTTIVPLLQEAIGHRGTSFRDYVDGFGNKGVFQLELAVYGRKGKPCPHCQTPIERIVVGGRSTHFCPKCQG